MKIIAAIQAPEVAPFLRPNGLRRCAPTRSASVLAVSLDRYAGVTIAGLRVCRLLDSMNVSRRA